jgi:hypothetical protein
MKMRHRALPVDPKDKSTSVDIDQRFHLQVIFEGDPSTTKVFWFRKVNLRTFLENLRLHAR